MANLFSRLFGKKQAPVPMRDVAALTAALKSPAIHLVATNAPSRSHLGGSPGLPPGFSWPEKNGRKLDFLARVSLKDAHSALSIPWLPESGALLFFYDIDNQPWGDDPGDRCSSAVLLVPDLAEALEQPIRRASSATVPHQNIAFRRIETLPPWDRSPVEALDLSDEESDAFFRLSDLAFDKLPRHQIAGYPMPVQNDDMELQCQLVRNAIDSGQAIAKADPLTDGLASGVEDWRLLLQFDTDDSLELMWGDCGTIYFWVREQEARVGNFDNTWLVLQCS